MEVREPIYTFEIARRSVGRAAFHLGIDTMSEGALDVLADILLHYLNRVGRTLSHLVESSGRTSAHVNLLDALHACELVTSPAVERLHVLDESGDHENDNEFPSSGTTAGSQSLTHLSSDWHGLAAFLFGPRWLTSNDDDHDAAQAPQGPSGVGGKVGPWAGEPRKKNSVVGWVASSLDKVPPFPVASEKCANPHPLPPYVGLSLHRATGDTQTNEVVDSEAAELDHIPDNVFTGSWGGFQKRKASSLEDTLRTEDTTMTDADDDASPALPPRKKVKIDDAKSKTGDYGIEETKIDNEQAQIKKRLHIPYFYPAPPVLKASTAEQKRTVVDITPAPQVEQNNDGSKSVRSSLVQLGNYWGSGWDAPAVDKSLVVPLGRKPTEERSSDLVVPLARASGSRVSRILEGSMDAAAMQ